MATKDAFWDKYGYVAGSKNRRTIVKSMDKPYTPLDLAKKTGIGMNMTSRALREMAKENIVICRNPKAKMGRVYELSNLGKRIKLTLKT